MQTSSFLNFWFASFTSTIKLDADIKVSWHIAYERIKILWHNGVFQKSHLAYISKFLDGMSVIFYTIPEDRTVITLYLNGLFWSSITTLRRAIFMSAFYIYILSYF